MFLGNFRGVYPRNSSSWKDKSTYWDYNIDDMATNDLEAFMKSIYEIKVKELKEIYYSESNMTSEQIQSEIEHKLTINYIGHSLGGMVLPMYVIN